jgi:hypothetical protein
LSSPLAIKLLRAGYLVPAFAFLAPDFELDADLRREPDFEPVERDLELAEPDFDLLALARDFDLVDVDPDFDPLELDPDFDLLALARDFDLGELDPDFDLLELDPDFDLVELDPDFDLVARPPPLERDADFDLVAPPPLDRDSDLDSVRDSGFDSVVGGSGGRVTGSMCLLRSVLASSGGGSPCVLSAPITSGTAPRREARWPLVSMSSP